MEQFIVRTKRKKESRRGKTYHDSATKQTTIGSLKVWATAIFISCYPKCIPRAHRMLWRLQGVVSLKDGPLLKQAYRATPQDTDAIVACLSRLEEKHVTFELMQKLGVGKIVKRLQTSTHAEVAARAQVRVWPPPTDRFANVCRTRSVSWLHGQLPS